MSRQVIEKITCDRCKKEVVDTKAAELEIPLFGWHHHLWPFDPRKFDLCPDCVCSLFQWEMMREVEG